MTSAPAIGFEYRPSRSLRRMLFLIAVLALLALALSALPAGLKWLLAAAVVLAATHSVQRLAAGSIIAAGWSADGAWTLHMADREDIPATLASFRILGAFVLLRLLTTERGAQVLLLAPDNSDADIRRRLRMRLATIQPGEAVPRL